MNNGYLRIGEFSQRVGVSAELLRAWEKRYGVLSPERSDGGFRLYSDDDVRRVDQMLAHLERGASAAEAARLALQAPPPAEEVPGDGAAPPEQWGVRLRERLESFDDAGAHAALDDALALFSVETVLRGVVGACLAELGDRWEAGEVSVAQEHFASGLLRGRLLSLAQGWGQGAGPRAVLAAPPGELHDLGLLICGVALFRRGVRVIFLGADCPIDTLARAVQEVRPALVLLAALGADPFRAQRDPLRRLSAEVPLHLAGAGASPELADDLGGRYLGDDPVSAAAKLSRRAMSPAAG
ncbi:MAG TPA: MerR family transcriptional regulator [Egibacteraceae bacterium]|nr:MerR family transcriptional regulator [Egibacteraceae bacterium]